MNREELQEDFSKKFLDYGCSGILLVAARIGKTRIGIKIFETIYDPKLLICFPDNKIEQSWRDEFEKMNYFNPNITFTNYRSLGKYIGNMYDVVICDEIHLVSERVIGELKELQRDNILLGLTGTLSLETQAILLRDLGMPVIVKYSTEDGIRDGIIADYRINIVTVPLDNRRLIQYKKKRRTEKQQFDAYSFIIKKLQAEEKNTMFLALGRLRIIQGSIAKMEKTRELIKKFKDERILVFCGLKKVADQLGIPVEHSSGGTGNLEKFAKGEGNHLAVCKLGNTGRQMLCPFKTPLIR